MLEGASVNELDALESDDLIPADNADSCHSSAVVGHHEAVPLGSRPSGAASSRPAQFRAK